MDIWDNKCSPTLLEWLNKDYEDIANLCLQENCYDSKFSSDYNLDKDLSKK